MKNQELSLDHDQYNTYNKTYPKCCSDLHNYLLYKRARVSQVTTRIEKLSTTYIFYTSI